MNSKKVLDETENIIWEEQTSSRKNIYYTGHLEEDDDQIKEPPVEKKCFGITCDWQPEKTEVQYDTETEFAKITGLVSYSVSECDEIYSYIISFTNTKHYNYAFYDETGDCYECDTCRNGKHFVKYNSVNPKIVYITGF